MKVYIGSDHRGLKLKEKIIKWLFDWGYNFLDLGAESLDIDDDYTKYASLVASLVSKEKNSKGVLLCGSGVGVDITSNKFDGVRASIGKNSLQVKAGRTDDDMNILVIASDFTKDIEAKEMLKVFLETKFEGKEKQKRRLEDITKIEANN